MLAVKLTTLERQARAKTWKGLRHAVRLDDGAYLNRLSGGDRSPRSPAQLLDELVNSGELRDGLASPRAVDWMRHHERLGRQHLTGVGGVTGRLDLNGPGRGRSLLLYGALRLLRPGVVIETGCFSGWDSAVMLLALKRNGYGRLHTIDLPGYTSQERTVAFNASLPHGGLPLGLAPGFLVSPALHERWDLRLGDARRLLPELLASLEDPIDVFFHDSEHSYSHMMWEYTSVAPHLPPGALVASDDLSFNTAFWDFCVAHELPRIMHRSNANVGAARWK